MVYTSDSLFIDESDLADMFSRFTKIQKGNIKKLYTKLNNIDYYYFLTAILRNLPEATIILFLGFFAVFNILKYTENSYGNKFYPIITSSMYPKIKPGSLIYSQKEDIYQVGDIVSYAEKTKEGISTGRVFTHRIIEKSDEGKFILRGDANINNDPLEIENKQIQGKVSFILPYLGYLDILTRSLPGFIILIALPSIFLIFRGFREVRSYIKSS